jgi:phospholipid-transporting ATPase
LGIGDWGLGIGDWANPQSPIPNPQLIILENIPIISPVIPVSTMVPYLLVLIIKLIREGVEDYFRYKYDKDINSQKTLVYRKGEWKEVNSGKLLVGEIVLVKKDETFPADLMLIDSDKEEGVAFIETSTLDGECSLKKKFAPRLMSENINNSGAFKTIFKNYIGKITCDEPNTEIFKFNGVVEFHYQEETQVHKFAVDNSQMLLKGAKLKSNEWACGIVVYTGHNTKLIKNLAKPKIKNSKVFNKMTRYIFLVFLVQAVLCSVCAGLNYYDYTDYVQLTNYLPKFANPKLISFLSYFSYLIIFKFMVPITLYVTFEVVRVCQSYLLWVNTDLYSHNRKKFTKVNTISVVEELGDINFVFTDKTGTLTVNKLDMRYCIIGNKCYEHLDKESDSNKAHDGIITLEDDYLQDFIKKEKEPEFPQWPHVKVLCEANNKMEMTFEKESDLIIEFWKALALAHECVAEDKANGREYVGLSPDDIVLVKAAAKQRICLEKLDKASSRKLKILNEEHEFEVLNVFEFNSDRKKLSIIVRDKGQIKLFIKGADSEIKKLLSPNSNSDFNDEAEHYVDFFSKSGLRTLYVGMKLIDEEEYNNWKILWENANTNLTNKEAEIKKAQMLMEKDIFLLGATVVEDELQDEVTETIKDLRQAGIKVWMLTGDKITTAYNIGLSCGMIHKFNHIFFVNGEKGNEFSTLKKEYDAFLESNKYSKKLPDYSIVIDSIILSTVFASEELTRQFIEISNKAESVICCRVSPLQKSLVVRVMRKYHSETISLAIGDGGNDVSMILEANIGKIINNIFIN